MKDDDILKTLGRIARQEDEKDGLDERWDRLSAGALTDEEVQRLRDESDRAFEAFRPLDEKFRTGVADKILAAQNTPPADSGAGASGADVVAFPARKRWTGAPLALAASLLVAVAVTFSILPGDDLPALPGYTTELLGGYQMRSAEVGEGTPEFETGDRFEFRLRPESAIAEPLAVQVFLAAGGSLVPLDVPPVQISPQGAARIVATIGEDLALPAGDNELFVVVGRGGHLPDADELAGEMTGEDVRANNWQAWRLRLRVED